MNWKISALLVFLLGCLNFGCTSVDLKKPATRLMTSEVSGHTLGGRVGMQLLGTVNSKMIKEPTSSAPSTNPNIDESQDVGVQLHLGLFSRMDAYVDTSLVGPTASGLKLQLLGNTLEQAKAGGLSISVFGAPLWGSWKQEDTKDSGKTNEVKAQSEISVSGYEAGLSLGYRFQDVLLGYMTAYHSVVKGKAHLDQTDSGVFTKNLVRVEGEGTIQSLALGLVIGKGFFVQPEAAYVLGEWKKTSPLPAQEAEDLKNFMFGLNAGLHW